MAKQLHCESEGRQSTITSFMSVYRATGIQAYMYVPYGDSSRMCTLYMYI